MATMPPPASAEAAPPSAKPLSHYTSRSPTLMVGTPTAVASNNPLGVHRIVAIDSPTPPPPGGMQGRPDAAGDRLARRPGPGRRCRRPSTVRAEPRVHESRRRRAQAERRVVGGPAVPEPDNEQRQGAKYIGRYGSHAGSGARHGLGVPVPALVAGRLPPPVRAESCFGVTSWRTARRRGASSTRRGCPGRSIFERVR